MRNCFLICMTSGLEANGDRVSHDESAVELLAIEKSHTFFPSLHARLYRFWRLATSVPCCDTPVSSPWLWLVEVATLPIGGTTTVSWANPPGGSASAALPAFRRSAALVYERAVLEIVRTGGAAMLQVIYSCTSRSSLFAHQPCSQKVLKTKYQSIGLTLFDL